MRRVFRQWRDDQLQRTKRKEIYVSDSTVQGWMKVEEMTLSGNYGHRRLGISDEESIT